MAVLMAAVPPHERPRERLLASGVEALSERELLALVLRNGTRGMSALDLAAELLAEYGILQAVAAARPEELAMRPGVGPAKAAGLVAAFQLARRTDVGDGVLVTLRSPEDVARVARRELDGARRERLLVLVCDDRQSCAAHRRRLRGLGRSIAGTRAGGPQRRAPPRRSSPRPRPQPSSGDPEPSEPDRRATDDVKAAATVAGLRFLGHVVVAGEGWRAVS